MSERASSIADQPKAGRQSRAQLLDAIVAQLEGMSFGSLVITVHDGRIVQLERTEKTRLF